MEHIEAKIAAALLRSRPRDLLTNHVGRNQWYRDVTELATLAADLATYAGAKFDADKFFNDAGVPS